MNDLQEQVKHIADEITAGTFEHEEAEEEGRDPNGFDYIRDALDIQYTVSGSKDYLGARILVAFGGPNIWIDTRTKTVEGYWWDGKAEAGYVDTLNLDDVCCELYEMI